MCQIVDYFENDVIYTEGPFVLSTVGRIEVELKGHHCPVLCNPDIYALLELERPDYKQGCWRNKQNIPVVDWLNEQVKLGRIVCKNGQWVVK